MQSARTKAEFRRLISHSAPTKTSRQRLHAIIPGFTTQTYGIPRKGPYYKTGGPRAFVNNPCCRELKKHEDDIEYAQIEALYNKLREIDDYLG